MTTTTVPAQPTAQNEAIIVGLLASAPDHHTYQAGASSATLLVTVRFEGRGDVLPVTVWQPDQAVLGAKRGTRVTVNGQIHRRFWVDKEGRHSRVEMVATSVEVGEMVDDFHPAEADGHNEALLVGKVATNIDYRTYPSGAKAARLLVTVRLTDPTRIDVLPVTVFEPDQAIVEAQRSMPVTVKGRLHRRYWTDTVGQHSRIEVVATSVELGQVAAA